jgi:poly-beta-1,6-N-acetyl-D-glucosamine synthase
MNRRYVIISPCRDEAEFCRQTLDSVVAQSLRPALWVIVDDGSKDQTPAILAEYAAKYDFIRVVRREDRGRRSVGPGVIEAFYAGYQTINPDEFDFICKLDLDLVLPPAYFQTLVERMEANPRLGNCSGKPYYHTAAGNYVSEGCGDENAIGAVKFYRTKCFKQVGGFVRQVMWDGIDGHRCRMLGWVAASWDDAPLRFTHLRPMGSSHKGILRGRARHGFGQYFMGTSPIYMLASVVFRLATRPFLIGGLAMGWGYFWAMLRRAPRYEDPQFRSFLRRFQWECLLLGKKKATRRAEERGSSKWLPVTAAAPSAAPATATAAA